MERKSGEETIYKYIFLQTDIISWEISFFFSLGKMFYVFIFIFVSIFNLRMIYNAKSVNITDVRVYFLFLFIFILPISLVILENIL